jgi:hypothetical protein
MTTTDHLGHTPAEHHSVDCELCWFAQEVAFADDANELDLLMEGVDYLLKDEDFEVVLDLARLVPWKRHREVESIRFRGVVADAAEYIACSRHSQSLMPRRPRVIAYLGALGVQP